MFPHSDDDVAVHPLTIIVPTAYGGPYDLDAIAKSVQQFDLDNEEKECWI